MVQKVQNVRNVQIETETERLARHAGARDGRAAVWELAPAF